MWNCEQEQGGFFAKEPSVRNGGVGGKPHQILCDDCKNQILQLDRIHKRCKFGGAKHSFRCKYFDSKLNEEDGSLIFLHNYIVRYFGEKCKTYDAHCPCCKAWKCFDFLTAHFVDSRKVSDEVLP